MKAYTLQQLRTRGFDLLQDGDKQLIDQTWGELQSDLDRAAGGQHTQTQIGYLAGLMDLEREDRLFVLDALVGFPLWYDGSQAYPGAKPLSELADPGIYPGPSSKDPRLTSGMFNVLISFYLENQDAHYIHTLLGFESAKAASKARGDARRAIAKAKRDEREARRAEREAKRAAKLAGAAQP